MISMIKEQQQQQKKNRIYSLHYGVWGDISQLSHGTTGAAENLISGEYM